MKLWELRSYDQVIKLEQERLVYQARLRSRFGRAWRRKAPVESLMPLRLARYGVPLAETAPAGLAAAGIEPALLPPAPAAAQTTVSQQPQLPSPRRPQPEPQPEPEAKPVPEPEPQPEVQPEVLPHESPWFAKHPASYAPEEPYDQWYEEQAPYDNGQHGNERYDNDPYDDDARHPAATTQTEPEPKSEREPEPEAQTEPEPEPEPDIPGLPDDVSRVEAYFTAFRKYVSEIGDYPNARQFSLYLMDLYGVTGQAGGPLTESTLRPYLRDFRSRYQQDLDAGADVGAEYIA